LLGALAAHEERLRARRRPHAPGGARRGRDAAADPAVLGAPLRGHPAALLRRRLRGRLPGVLAGSRCGLHRGSGAPLPPRRSSVGAAPVPVLAALFGAAVRRHGSRCPTALIGFPPMLRRRLASKNIRTALVVSGICLVMFAFTFFV